MTCYHNAYGIFLHLAWLKFKTNKIFMLPYLTYHPSRSLSNLWSSSIIGKNKFNEVLDAPDHKLSHLKPWKLQRAFQYVNYSRPTCYKTTVCLCRMHDLAQCPHGYYPLNHTSHLGNTCVNNDKYIIFFSLGKHRPRCNKNSYGIP